MPLDPQVRKLLGWAARSHTPPYDVLGAVAAREHYAKAATSLDIAPAPLDAVLDFTVDLPGRSLKVRQYQPVPVSWAEPTGALLFFHGGGFTIGSIATHDALCRSLAAQAGCQVFSVDYRLAPEHRFPAAQDDAFDMLAWLRGEAASLAVDPARIAVGGDSAGGTLAAACAIHARDQGWPLACQLLIYPGLSPDQQTTSHQRFAQGYLLDESLIQWFFSNTLRSPADRQDWRFAPLVHPDLRGVAPCWLALAEYDPLVDEGLAYGQRLQQAGIDTRVSVYPGVLHAFFQHGGLLPLARTAQTEAAAALRAALAGEALPVLQHSRD